jgi:hypothetical protein
MASRIDAYTLGQEAANYRQHPDKLGAAYYQGRADEDWAHAQILAQYGPH